MKNVPAIAIASVPLKVAIVATLLISEVMIVLGTSLC